MRLKTIVFSFCCVFGSSTVLHAERSSFPNPESGIRVDTPDDPGFDCNEPDDEDGAEVACGGLFDEQIQILGFAPSGSASTAIYRACPPTLVDCVPGVTPQISGIKADAAWKLTLGRPDIVINVTDTGIRWDREQLRTKIFLNRGELPLPLGADDYDANGDGAFNADDYAADTRVVDSNESGAIDGQDLIRAFSDGRDDDGNGYVDDIAGWDFLEDDNDPDDTSSYSAARNHGSGRAQEAAQTTNDGSGDAGVCPECQILVTRVWDTFVVPSDHWAAATVYAADMGAKVQVTANGVLGNSHTMREANRYAHRKGMALMHVSSDLNTANHNYPTNYVESIYINGCAADGHGGSTEFDLPGLDQLGFGGANVPILTWFRNSGLTQFGAHAHVCITAVTGSEATGHAGGGAGLLLGLGRDMAAEIGGELSAFELKQLLTLNAEDVLPENTDGLGSPDPAQPGWDEHFGYGRADLGESARQLAAGKIPPEVLIERPAWFAILDPETTQTVPVGGRVAAPRSTDCRFRLEWAPGVEPANDSFVAFAGASDLDCKAGIDGPITQFDLQTVAEAFPGSRTGEQGADINQFLFTVRLVATDANGVSGEDRKTYFVYHDPTWASGWPKFVDSGGESSPMLYDLNGDGAAEYIDANTSGELWVWQGDGTPLPTFNNGRPWQAPPNPRLYHPGLPAYASGAVPPPTSGFRSPSIGDVDGDGWPEIVATTADGRIYILSHAGVVERVLEMDGSLSTPALRDGVNHPKRGTIGTTVIADLEGDGEKELILGGLDNHIYVWSGKTGALRPGFPVNLVAEGFVGDMVARGEIIATPGVADLDGDGVLEIVSGNNDVIVKDPGFPSSPPDLQSGTGALLEALITNTAGQSTRVFALKADGSIMPGWPVEMGGLLADILPLVGPQHGLSVGDVDDDGLDEVVASMTTGDVHIIDGDGSFRILTSNGVVVGSSATSEVPQSGAIPLELPAALAPAAPTEPSRILNLFEYTVIGDLNGVGGLDIAKGGVTAPAAVNLVLVGQNVPFTHVMQAWDSALTESYLPGFPVATDDFQLLSTPAIADVDGSGASVVYGTGLYLLHANNGLTGLEASGFPKLTGGWLFNTPAIGDTDGDGMLELVTGTREGYRFVWDLQAPATQAALQWPMEGHDPCHSNNYGTDCVPPARVTGVTFEGDVVKWNVTGDDGRLGFAVAYRLVRLDAEGVVTRVVAELPFPGLPASLENGQFQLGLPLPSGISRRDLALIAVDDAGNVSLPQRLDGESVTPGTPGTPNNSLRRGGAAGGLVLLMLLVFGLVRLNTRRI